MPVTAVADSPLTTAEVIEHLGQALSETMVGTSKAQTYHWNVTGMALGPLHFLFRDIYEDHFAAQDLIAERIKALGGHADGRLSTALSRSSVTECDGRLKSGEMVANLARDQRKLSSTFQRTAQVAEEFGDGVSHDLSVERSNANDKFA